MPDPLQSVLVVEGLRVETASGADIVDDISFSVAAGEVLALVGESACGKTSTALALLGHARPGTRIVGGSVRLAGRELLRLAPNALRRTRGREIAYVPQDPASSLSPRHAVGAQIAQVLSVHSAEPASIGGIVAELARRVGLDDDPAFLRRYPFQLSGGQQQRVAIAMALACRPLVVVLDEPTTGLDVTTQARVLDLLAELGRTSGAAFVYVTHDLAVVDAIASTVAVMYAGRIVEAGPREDVLYRAAHPYTALLLDSVPRLSVRSRLKGIAGTAPAPRQRPAGCHFAPRCPLADDRCRTSFPPAARADRHRLVRCWRPSQQDISDSTPAGDSRVPPAVRAGLLRVEGLVASYGGKPRRTVLRDIGFTLGVGECLSVVGESGSGKSTLARCIAGLHAPEAGAVWLDGALLAPTAALREHRQRQAIQIIFQNPERSLNPNETVAHAIGRPLRLFGLAGRGAERARAAALLGQVRLPGSVLDRYPRELSGGEKQRVAIARALAAEPSVLLCDEITSSLDVSTQAAIMALLEELKAGGLALLFITHNLALVHAIADRVLVLEGGEVRECGPASRVIAKPQHPYTQALLAAAPELGRGAPLARSVHL